MSAHPEPIPFARSMLGNQHVCAFFISPREDTRRPYLAIEILHTHPVAIIGGVLVEKPSFSQSEEFLRPEPYRG